MTISPAPADVTRIHVTAPAGGLLWAFHEGFAAYVSRLADGRVDVDGGAQLQRDGSILFPFTPEAPALHGTGAVHFTGHHGLLAVTLANPAVVGTSSSAVLAVDDPFIPGERLTFAQLGEPTFRRTDCYPLPLLTEATNVMTELGHAPATLRDLVDDLVLREHLATRPSRLSHDGRAEHHSAVRTGDGSAS